MTKMEQALAKLATLPPEAKLEEALTKLAELPPEDQDTIADIILDYVPHDEADEYQLSDEQYAEIERRLAEENPETVSLEEFLDRIKSLGR